MPVIAVFGAGPGIGQAVASQFGAHGYEIALVARDRERLAQQVKALSADGITTEAFLADLRNLSTITDAVHAILDRFGRIDAVHHGPGPSRDLFRGATDATPEDVLAALETVLIGAIHITNLILPSMRERSDGSLLFTQGASARLPMPSIATLGLAQSGLRNWIYCLHEELRELGIYVGTVTIAAAVTRDADPGNPMTVNPSEIADRLWKLTQSRAAVEEVVGDLSLFPRPAGWDRPVEAASSTAVHCLNPQRSIDADTHNRVIERDRCWIGHQQLRFRDVG